MYYSPESIIVQEIVARTGIDASTVCTVLQTYADVTASASI